MEDVALEQLDPLLDGHVGEFGRRQVGELLAGLVDRGPLLLLEDRVGHVPHGGDGVRAGGVAGDGGQRHGQQVEVAVVGGAQRDAAGPASGRRAQGVGLGDGVERRAEVAAPRGTAAAPRLQPIVRPQDPVVGIEQGHTVGQMPQDLWGDGDVVKTARGAISAGSFRRRHHEQSGVRPGGEHRGSFGQ